MEAVSPTEASVTITKGCDLTFQKDGMFNSTVVKMSNHIFFQRHHLCSCVLSVTHSLSNMAE